MPIQSYLSKLGLDRFMPHLMVLSLVGAGAVLLAWVGWLTWVDMSQWGKDIGSVLLGSRAGEAISLGIGMTVLNYVLVGIALLGAGAMLFIKNHVSAAKPQFVMRTKPPKPNPTTYQKPTYQTTTYLTENKKPEYQTDNPKPELKSDVKEETAAASEETFFSGCLHHFGYLSSRPEGSPIPDECILCQRLGDCMVATVYVNKFGD